MIDQPVDLDQNPPVETAAADPFPTLGRVLSRRVQDPRAMALQERRLADNEHIAQRNFAVQAQKLELEKIRHLTELQKEEAAIRHGIEVQRQHQVALAGLLSIKPGDDPVDAAAKIIQNNPEAVKDPAIMDIFRSHVATRQAQRAADIAKQLFQEKQNMEKARIVAERDDLDKRAAELRNAPENAGMIPEQMTPHGAGGSVTLQKPKDTSAADLKSLEKERSLYATEFAKARSRRQKFTIVDDSNKDEVAAADADVTDYHTKLSDVESRMRAHREAGIDNASAAVPSAAPEQPSSVAPSSTPVIAPVAKPTQGGAIRMKYVDGKLVPAS